MWITITIAIGMRNPFGQVCEIELAAAWYGRKENRKIRAKPEQPTTINDHEIVVGCNESDFITINVSINVFT